MKLQRQTVRAACLALGHNNLLIWRSPLQGILEQVTTATVNLVNADLLAKNRGLNIIETTIPAKGKCVQQRRKQWSASACHRLHVPPSA